MPKVIQGTGGEAGAETQHPGCSVPPGPGALKPSSFSAQREELMSAPHPQEAGSTWLVCILALLQGSELSAGLLWVRSK